MMVVSDMKLDLVCTLKWLKLKENEEKREFYVKPIHDKVDFVFFFFCNSRTNDRRFILLDLTNSRGYMK